MQTAQIIVLATPVFFALIGLEWWLGQRRGRNTYRLHDAMASIGLGMVSQLANAMARLGGLGLYTLLWQHAVPWHLPVDAAWVWISALLLYDLAYYWHHRLGHRVAVLWAAHAVHHQSEDYNLSTALRQTGSNWLLGWLFYLPLALLGYPPLVVGTVALVDLLYQFWVHTQQVGKLGWFDRWFCSPSNHRVHHAVNDAYVDRNYGGILMLWDRLFGTFTEERDDEPCVYGTRTPLHSWDPLRANLQVYAGLWHDSRQASTWADKLRVWLKPPGWRPADVAARFPKPDFDIARVQRWDPQPPLAARCAAVALFVAMLALVVALLWQAHVLGTGAMLLGTAVVLAGLGAVGWLGRQGRPAPIESDAQRA